MKMEEVQKIVERFCNRNQFRLMLYAILKPDSIEIAFGLVTDIQVTKEMKIMLRDNLIEELNKWIETDTSYLDPERN
jgi:hypothetical protein